MKEYSSKRYSRCFLCNLDENGSRHKDIGERDTNWDSAGRDWTPPPGIVSSFFHSLMLSPHHHYFFKWWAMTYSSFHVFQPLGQITQQYPLIYKESKENIERRQKENRNGQYKENINTNLIIHIVLWDIHVASESHSFRD